MDSKTENVRRAGARGRRRCTTFRRSTAVNRR